MYWSWNNIFSYFKEDWTSKHAIAVLPTDRKNLLYRWNTDKTAGLPAVNWRFLAGT